MKKLLPIALGGLTALGLIGCGSSNDGYDKPDEIKSGSSQFDTATDTAPETSAQNAPDRDASEK